MYKINRFKVIIESYIKLYHSETLDIYTLYYVE